MAHAFGAELDITPWEALLRAVRIAAGKVAYCEWVISSAKNDLELEGRIARNDDGLLLHPDTGEPLGVGAFRDLTFWVQQSTLWHDRMAKTAKLAIDAGVAKWQIEKAEAEAKTLIRVLNAVLDGLDGEITEAQAVRARALMRAELLRIDAEMSQKSVTAGDPDDGAVDSTYELGQGNGAGWND